MTQLRSDFSLQAICALCLVHFTGDMYQSFIHPLLPVVKERFALSLAQIGIIASAVNLASFLSQPMMGMLADRYRPRRFMMAGLMLSVTFIPLLGITPRFGWLVLLAGMGALGSAMYHPPTAAMVTTYAGRHTGTGLALFGLGGTLAFSVGPLAVTAFIVLYGLERLPVISLAGFVAIGVLLFLLPANTRMVPEKTHFFRQVRQGLGGAWKAIVLIWLVGSLRSIADVALRGFYPVHFMDSTGSLVSTGAVLSFYTVGAAVSALACGAHVDRNGYKPLFYFSFLCSTPCILLFLSSRGYWVYPLAFVAGFVLLATLFPSVALATKIAPDNKSLVSSITLGFSTGTGGLFAPLTGHLADTFGLLPVLTALAFVPLLCLPIIPFILEKKGV